MMKMVSGLLVLGLALSGCAAIQSLSGETGPAAEVAALPPPSDVAATTLDPTPPPAPPASANTAAALDTTTPEDRAEALAPAPVASGEQRLGTTLASLGAPTDPGIWMKTGLVTSLTQGRIEYQGTSINIELRPSDGPADAGSQISLAAMRLLNAPLTGIVEVTVFAGGTS